MIERKSISVYTCCAVAGLIIAGFAYFWAIALPVFKGTSDLYPFIVGDATLYMDPDVQNAYLANGLQIRLALFRNVLGMLLMGKAACAISESQPEFIVLLMNIVVLIMSVVNYRKIFEFYKLVGVFPLFLTFLLINPLLMVSLVALNKEIWGVFFLSSFAKNRIYGKHLRFFLSVALAFLVRDAFCATGLIFFLVTTLRIKKIYYLAAFSLLIPLVTNVGMVEFLVEGQDEYSMGVSMLLHSIQIKEFGYILTYIPKVFLSTMAPISPVRILLIEPENLVGLFSTVSAALFLAFVVLLTYRVIFLRRTIQGTSIGLLFSFTLFVGIPSYIHHRYMFPAYPILLVVFFLSSYGCDCESLRLKRAFRFGRNYHNRARVSFQ